MNLSTFWVGAASLVYLGLLAVILWLSQHWAPAKRLSQHPFTHTLALGVFASAWSIYGAEQLALEYGYGALAYYLGSGALFLFAPLTLVPLAELCRRYQLTSLADLLVFRYHSNIAGTAVTVLLVLSLLPLLAAQFQSLSQTFELLTHGHHDSDSPLHSNHLATGCYMLLTLALSLFAADKQRFKRIQNLLAFDTLVKIFALNCIGLLAVFGVFGGLDALDAWLLAHPENYKLLYYPLRQSSSHTLLLIFVASAIVVPNLFHSGMLEQPRRNLARILPWAFPALLFLLALPIFPILWAGIEAGVPAGSEYFALGLPMLLERPGLALMMYLAGLSAATTAVVTIVITLSTMVLNHILLPLTGVRRGPGLSQQLRRLRRHAIGALMALAFVLYSQWQGQLNLTELALLSFIASAQFVPGLIAISYWPRGNRRGFTAGLMSGGAVWILGLVVPTALGHKSLSIGSGPVLHLGLEHWDTIALAALGLNALVFIWVSLQSQASAEESYSADLCAEDELSQPVRSTLDVYSVREMQLRLRKALGRERSEREMNRALAQLKLSGGERRPYALRRLRDQLETNLCGIVGVRVAHDLVERHIPLQVAASPSADVNLMEARLAQTQGKLSGLAADLNNLRLYHRNTVQELPMAVCALGQDLEVLMWNHAMGDLSGLPSDSISGSHLDSVGHPWGKLIGDFYRSHDTHWPRQAVQLGSETHWISLHKAATKNPINNQPDGAVFLLEDVTETHRLEQELLHSERLASVGRLAAGVAHEIGNPVTGIACLAQNLRYETDSPEAHETAEQILSQTDRITRIVQSLVNFSHSGHPQEQRLERVNIQACVDEAIHLLQLQPLKPELRFDNQIALPCHIMGDSQRLIQVFINLLSNARDASPETGVVTIAQCPSDTQLILTVTDQGPGIAEEHLDQILEPFFTTKDIGEGTGLGLAMVYSIINEHGGSIEVCNVDPADGSGGAQFIIKLPLELETERAEGNTTDLP
ncbi:MAG: ATP-binding protein [Cellvibrionaceae bacterium]|nr:ATP-binding protein [Cellvibrionaceae bacterium]